jgi:hypothetical protein
MLEKVYFLSYKIRMRRKPGRPKSKNPRNVLFQFRTTAREATRIRWLARTYAGGDLSEWLRHAALSAERRYLTKKGLAAKEEKATSPRRKD